MEDGTGGESIDFSKLTDEQKSNMIGKTITGYNPSFNKEADVQAGTIKDGTYTPLDEYTGRKSLHEEQGAFDTESLGWRIWGIDENNIYLISAEPTLTVLILSGAQGYNNGVYILNEICKTCYTDSKYKDAKVRSMNIRDIEKLYDDYEEGNRIMEYDYSTYSHDSYDGIHKYGTNNLAYTLTWPTAYTKFDEQDTAKPFDSRNSQSELIQEGEDTQTRTEKYPYMSSWSKKFRSESSLTGFAGTDVAKAYVDMIFDYDPSYLSSYYLASRCVFPQSSNSCDFSLQFVSNR